MISWKPSQSSCLELPCVSLVQVTASVLAAAVWSVGAAPASDPRAAHAGQREYSGHCMIRAQAAIFMHTSRGDIRTDLHIFSPAGPCVVHVTHCM